MNYEKLTEHTPQRTNPEPSYYGLWLSQEEVATGEGGSEDIISELLPYDIVGDVSVVCNVPQPHTVRVCDLCSLLRIDKQSLTSILQIYSKDSRQILSNLLKASMAVGAGKVSRSPAGPRFS
jgi:hypothetical protein